MPVIVSTHRLGRVDDKNKVRCELESFPPPSEMGVKNLRSVCQEQNETHAEIREKSQDG